MATQSPYDHEQTKPKRRRKRTPATMPLHKLWKGMAFKDEGSVWILCNERDGPHGKLISNAICIIPKKGSDLDVGETSKIDVEALVQPVNLKWSYQW
jgi:hypothetical protein